METKGSSQHPSAVDPNLSDHFTDPSIKWARRRMAFRQPDEKQTDIKKDEQIPTPSSSSPSQLSPIIIKISSHVKKPERGQANTKKVQRKTLPPPPTILTKRSSLGKSPERGDQVSVAASKKSNGAPAASARGHEGFNLRSKGAFNGESSAKKAAKAVNFSAKLTEDEIIEDFIAMTGKEPPRRPKRMPKKARECLKGIFPGSDLPEAVTAKRYKIRKDNCF